MKTKLFLAAAAAIALVGCNKEGDNVQPTADGPTSFLSVSIKSAGTITKAPEDKFEYGLDAENNVTNVDFYFFDASGAAYTLENGEDSNWLSVKTDELPDDDKEGTTTSGNDIEAYTDVVLVIKQSKQTPPAKMVALVNVADGKTYAGKSLSDLTAMATESFKTTNGFVMSNSVYEDGAIVKATDITSDNIYTSPDPTVNVGDKLGTAAEVEALGISPVVIYVERVAAKVRVKSSVADATSGLIAVVDADDKPFTVNDAPVYAQVLGWNVTNTTDCSYLIKDVAETDLFTPWNNAGFYRSYWANTHASAKVIHGLTYNGLITNPLGLGNYSYYHENTRDPETNVDEVNDVDPDATTDETEANQAPQLLVAAKLVDANGKALDLAKWYGSYYTMKEVQTAMINTVAAKIYVVDTEKTTADAAVYRSITASDVTFYQVSDQTSYTSTTAEKDDEGNYAGPRRYEVKVKATADTKYYDATGKELEATTVEGLLDAIAPAQIWKDAYTYYYTTIAHFGNATSAIVRNHLYDIDIKSVQGLGTPVFDPTQIITPEQTVDQEAYHLAAQINILTWHLVSQDVALGY